MEDFLGLIVIVAIFVFIITVTIIVALIRWVFCINEQIEILSQIREELKKLNERKV